MITGSRDDVILGTRNGMAIRFSEKDARPIGRATSGVRGIHLGKGDVVVGMVTLLRPDTTLLVVTEGGMGKRTRVDAYRFQQRGGKGVINIKTGAKAGRVVAIKSVMEEDELMVITRHGVVNRQRVSEIRTIGRATQGVRLVNLDKKDSVVDVARVIAEDADEGEVGEGAATTGTSQREPLAEADPVAEADVRSPRGLSGESGRDVQEPGDPRGYPCGRGAYPWVSYSELPSYLFRIFPRIWGGRSASSASAFKGRGPSRFGGPSTSFHNSPTELAGGVITYSSGNHGQAMALAAREKGSGPWW